MIAVYHRGSDALMNESELFGPFEGGYEDETKVHHFYETYLCRCHGDIVKQSRRNDFKVGISTLLEAGQLS